MPSVPSVELIRAAAAGDLDKVRRLLMRGADPNHTTRDGEHALFAAAEHGDVEVCRLLLKADVDVNLPGPQRNTALIVAAGHGREAVVRLLLHCGAEVDRRGNEGRTALFNAAAGKNTAVVRQLLDAGADLFAKDDHGRTPVSEAADFGGKRVQKLIRELAEQMAPEANLTLHDAAGAGNVALIQQHLAKGVDVDQRDRHGRTPLMHAARRGQTAATEALLAAGADPDLTTPRGDHALLDAACADAPEVIQRLLAARVIDAIPTEPRTIDVLPAGDMTPLMIAAVFGNHKALRCLLDAGADPNFRNREGQSALTLAKRGGNRKGYAALQQTVGAPPDELDAVHADVKAFKTRCEEPSFQQALELMARRCGHKPYPWKKRKGVFRFWIRDAKRLANDLGAPAGSDRQALIARLQDEVRGLGFRLIVGDAIDRNPPLMLFPTANQYAVIKACGTNANRLIDDDGAAGFADAGHLIGWLQQLEKTHPWQLTECGFDFLGGRFTQPPSDAAELALLAQRLVAFCPDMLDEDPNELVKELATRGRFFCWWD